MNVVIASGNQGKLNEFRTLLSPYKMEVVAQSDLGIEAPEETGLTFIENALIKARHACAASDLPAIADDSGLAVGALQGAPGIYSARYAGEGANDADNIVRLLRELEGVAEAARSATFHCVLVYLEHAEDPTPIVCHGQWKGRILDSRRGEGGFGYDPVFWVPEKQCAAAELSKQEKNAISHRGKAMMALLAAIESRQAQRF